MFSGLCKGISQKYIGKYAIKPFLLSFLTEFIHQITTSLLLFDVMWLYVHMTVFWLYGHKVKWINGIIIHQCGCRLINLGKELSCFYLFLRNESKYTPTPPPHWNYYILSSFQAT
jgi:hypothetical protein